MKKLGILGGMSWESTQHYYQRLNLGIRKKLGGFHSANLLIRSYDFDLIARLQHQDKWDELHSILTKDALSLQNAGADALIIAANTMHALADGMQEKLDIPIIHITDTTAGALIKRTLKRPLLLGTEFTMKSPFFKNRLQENFSIDTLVPKTDEQKLVHQIIYDELVRGKINNSSREKIEEIIKQFEAFQKIDSVILGCTELPLLMEKTKLKIPMIDTMDSHINGALAFLLDN